MSNLIAFLPNLNAVLNTTSAILLLSGYRFIKLGRVTAHRNCQIAALISSTVFLASYVTYHSFHGTTHFLGQGIVWYIYFAILTSHTILAVIIVPLVFVTFFRALRGDFERHRRIARWTLPLWLYVSVTGVIVYLMLYRIYPAT
jgi:putative membrane protein